MSKKFEEALQNKLQEIERGLYRLEWPNLKSWLESMFTLLTQSNGVMISDQLVLRLSKIFIYSLLPSVPDPLHNITLNIFEYLASYIPVKQIVLLGFSIFPHIRTCTASNFGNYLRIINIILEKYPRNLCIFLSILTCLMSGLGEMGEKNNLIRQLIEEKSGKNYCIITEEILWVYVLNSTENQIPILKVLKNLKEFRTRPILYQRAFEFGMSNEISRVKQASIDSLTSKIKLNEQQNGLEEVKITFLCEIMKNLNDKSILMRFDHWLPEEINEYGVNTIINAILRLHEKKFTNLISLTEKIWLTERFETNFLTNLSPVLLGKLKEEMESLEEKVLPIQNTILVINSKRDSEKTLSEKKFIDSYEKFEKLYSKDTYKIIWNGLIERFEKKLYRDDKDLVTIILFALKVFPGKKEKIMNVMNLLSDNVTEFKVSEELFECFAEMITFCDKLPVNSHIPLEKFKEIRLIPQNSALLSSYINFYKICIAKANRMNISFKVDPLNYPEFPIIIQSFIKHRLQIESKALKKIWKDYPTNKNENRKLLLNSIYCERSWINAVLKTIKEIEGILSFSDFARYCLEKGITEFEELFLNSEILIRIFKEKINNVEASIQKSRLIEYLSTNIKMTFDFILTQLAISATELKPNVNLMIDYFEMLKELITANILDLLLKKSISADMFNNVKTVTVSKFKCESYFDLILCICFKYLVTYVKPDNFEFRISAKETIIKISNLSKKEMIQKIFNISAIYLEFNFSHTSLQIVEIVSEINLNKKFETITQKGLVDTLLKDLKKIIFSEKNFNSNQPELVSKTFNLFNKLINHYLLRKEDNFLKSVFNYLLEYLNTSLDFSLVETLKDLIFTIVINEGKSFWVFELLFNENYNFFEFVIKAYKSSSINSSTIQEIKEIIHFLFDRGPKFAIEGIIFIWIKLSTKHESDLKLITNFFPCIDLPLDIIIYLALEKASEKNFWGFINFNEHEKKMKVLAILLFVYKYLCFNEDHSLFNQETNSCFVKFFEFASNTVIPEVFVVGILIFEKIRKNVNDLNLKNTIAEFFRKSLENFVKFSLESNTKCLDLSLPSIVLTKNIKSSRLVTEFLQRFSCFKLISLVFPDQGQRLEFLSMPLKLFLKYFPSFKFSCHNILDLLGQWIKFEPKLYLKLQPLLLGFSSNDQKFSELMHKFPKCWFRFGILLNLCDSHSRVFLEFRKPFHAKSRNQSVRIQESARLLFLTSFLIFTGQIDDFIAPDLINAHCCEIENLIENDTFFGVCCLALQVLFVRLSEDEFLMVWQRIWPFFSVKYNSKEVSNSVLNQSCVLKLVELFLLKDFSEICSLNFNNSFRYKLEYIPKKVVFSDYNPKSMQDIRTYTVELIKQFNQFHSELNHIDSKSIEKSIQNEFLRLKVIIFA